MINLFVARKWQKRCLRDYQTKAKKNYLLEACVSAGKTAEAVYIYDSLKTAFGWDFLLAVVPSDHLKKQYAQDAMNLFGLNLYYSGTSKRLGRLPSIDELLQKGYEGLVTSYQWLSTRGNADKLKQNIEISSAKKIP
ncbi:hypothetical protein Sta7437_3362 [Stanieria cyanosphaera PCC 7437]|uniref:Helicase/UvrB N-terminal domain-containing protein n=1 Tax=Stanieria cyanosphaera (strain ATCC 29371 / PCC 7437) TaxID=111780 RepID=K9XWF2_STAC7|nr:hypothetical protein [Stanieria cyanosphaera]AFZ36868.1 hypothetical protein Sta7437_3362 [Stanieria cyanosphaera PCC 7437]